MASPLRKTDLRVNRVRAFVGAAVVASAAGCGRTSLSRSVDASFDDDSRDAADVAASACAADTGTLYCRAALQSGAPTAINGLCSTRAHIATTRAPMMPRAAWSTSLGSTFQPLEALVDRNGRIYATIDPDVQIAVEPRTLVAVDPNGSIVWRHEFQGGVGSLFLASDCLVRATVRNAPGSARMLVALTPDGTIVSQSALPDNTGARFAVGADGSLYSVITDFNNPDVVVKLSLQGAMLWASPPLDPNFVGSASAVALTADDRVVVATLEDTMAIGSTVFELDATGAIAWQTNLDSDFSQGPSIAPDGTIRIVGGVLEPGASMVLYSLDANGRILWRTDLSSDGQQTGGDPLAITPDGTTVLRTFRSVIAVSAAGRILWTMPVYPNGYYDAAIDATGALIALTADSPVGLSAIDPTTGVQRWTYNGQLVFTGLAFGLDGTLVMLGGEGTVTLLRGP